MKLEELKWKQLGDDGYWEMATISGVLMFRRTDLIGYVDAFPPGTYVFLIGRRMSQIAPDPLTAQCWLLDYLAKLQEKAA